MKREGPALESLTRRLAECPAEFLAAPRIGSAGKVHLAAVVSDLLRDLGGPPMSPEAASTFQSRSPKVDSNRFSLMLLTCWLLHHPWFRSGEEFAPLALALLSHGLSELARATPSAKFVSDADRREELARVCLRELGLRPAGETIEQSQDRLVTLNFAERQRVIRASRQAEERARKIREAMQRVAEAEANAKVMRE
jgi:hypothetical protein